MRSNKPMRVGNLLDRSQMARLLSRATALKDLDRRLHELIPAPLNEHCRVLSVDEDTLVVAADSPVWAARLRFHTAQLVKKLSAHPIAGVHSIRIRVRPPENPPENRIAHPQQRLSENNATALQQAARGVSDPGLKSALMRLANRRRSPGQN